MILHMDPSSHPSTAPFDPIEKEIPTYISVDVEAAGPNPSEFSLLSLGACTIRRPRSTFYVELKPVNDNALPAALEVSDLSLAELAERGLEPREALERFEEWLKHTVHHERPIFIGFNAPFDWMFVTDYFHRFLGRNPFGYSAIDIKSFYMGLKGVSWEDTSMRKVSPIYLGGRKLSHNALDDAMVQADLFEKMLEELKQNKGGSDEPASIDPLG